MSNHKQFDNEESAMRARAVMPTSRLMEMNGHGIRDGKCPFCGKDGATLRKGKENGIEWFKCWKPDCPSDTAPARSSWNELSYLSHLTGEKEWKKVFIHWLKLANVYEEPTPRKDLSGQDGSASTLNKPRTAPTASPAVEPGKVVEFSGPKPDHANATKGPALSSDSSAPPPRVATPLEVFYAGTTLRPSDAAKLWHDRGLTEQTCAALGFRSSQASNKALLEKLSDKFEIKQLIAEGWWKDEEKVNSQFYGYGIVGKNSKLGHSYDRKNEFEWGFCEPVLIPYFDEQGELIHLRPHKGMLAGVNPRLYVPRSSAAFRRLHPELYTWWEERFDNVVITEGEFKAAALWEMVGQGLFQSNIRGELYGICSMPGITMSKNYGVRMDLEEWIQAVGAKKVIVSFDNEEKSDPKLPSYKPDYRRRYESEVWARYLAVDLSRKLHIEGQYLQLPDEWRDKNGKADWDGVLGAVYRGELQM